MPDREERLRTMLDMVEALVGRAPRVLDLACGTGTITARLLERFQATSTGVDLDPALLAIAEEHLRGRPDGLPGHRRPQGPRLDGAAAVRLLRRRPDRHGPALAPRRTPSRPSTVGSRIWSATAVSYERGPHDRRDDAPGSTRPSAPSGTRRWRGAKRDGALDWAEWWQLAAKDPVLAGPTARRFEIYGEHADGDMPSAAWHARVLREKGFGEVRPVWCSPSDTLLLALK